MELPPQPDPTELLLAAAGGDGESRRQVFSLLYDQLHAQAARYFAGERVDHTLQPTALVHEVFVKLVSHSNLGTESNHFRAIAAQAMKLVLLDAARERKAQKRGGGRTRVTLHSNMALTRDGTIDVLALNQALTKLAALDERKARVVELRFFGGMTIAEAAECLDVSKETMGRDWAFARAWLHRELGVGD